MVDCINPACRRPDAEAVLERSVPSSPGGEAYEFTLRYCRSCRVAFVHPPPSAELLAGLYHSDYPYHLALDPTTPKSYAWKLRLAALGHRHVARPGGARGTFGWAASALAAGIEALGRRSISFSLGVPPALPRDAAILDFGFGTGAWLLAMHSLGYRRLFGFDLANNEANVHRLEAHGIRASCAPPAEAFPEQRFDCVRLEHVFEHLLDPLVELRRIGAILRPGGLLVMTFPSIYSWEPVEDLPASPHLAHLQLPIHLVHHSLDSARGFVEAAGLELAAIRVTRPYPYISLAARAPG